MEDLIFNLCIFEKKPKICFVNQTLYNYRIRKQSALNSKLTYNEFNSFELIINNLIKYKKKLEIKYIKNYILDFYKRKAIDKKWKNKYIEDKVKIYKEYLIKEECYDRKFKLKTFIIKELPWIYRIKYKINNKKYKYDADKL